MLKKKYLIDKREKLLELTPSVTFHWMNLQCEKHIPFSVVDFKPTSAAVTPADASNPPVKEPEAERPHTYAGDLIHKITDTLSHIRHVDADEVEAVVSGAGSSSGSPSSASAQGQEAAEQHPRCAQMLTTHHVVPGSSWGTLPEEQQRFDLMKCDNKNGVLHVIFCRISEAPHNCFFAWHLCIQGMDKASL